MPRTRNLQTTNRNVRSPKTMTRPGRAVGRRLPGRDRTTDSSKPHAIASRRVRAVFAVTMPPGSLRCETETTWTARTSFPPRSSPSSADPNEDRSIQSSGRSSHLPRTEHLSSSAGDCSSMDGAQNWVCKRCPRECLYPWYRRSLCECALAASGTASPKTGRWSRRETLGRFCRRNVLPRARDSTSLLILDRPWMTLGATTRNGLLERRRSYRVPAGFAPDGR